MFHVLGGIGGVNIFQICIFWEALGCFRCGKLMAIHFSPFSLICGPPCCTPNVCTRGEIGHAQDHYAIRSR